MTIEELIIYGKKYIHSNEAKMLLANVLNYDFLELLNHLDEKVDNDKIEIYKNFIDYRLNNYPIQYILGSVNFYGYNFFVDKNVLIPRFETEELVYYVLQFIYKNFKNGAKVIDLGCGSGVIGITLSKKNPQLEVTCLDISNEALEVTRKNAKALNSNITIIQGDMLDNIDEKYDIIVSNPPYIAESEEIEDIVKDNEPHLALYAGEDGLLYYNKILKSAKNVIKDKFLIAFEIGHTQKESITKLANKYLNNITIKSIKDIYQRDRIILIYSNNFN